MPRILSHWPSREPQLERFLAGRVSFAGTGCSSMAAISFAGFGFSARTGEGVRNPAEPPDGEDGGDFGAPNFFHQGVFSVSVFSSAAPPSSVLLFADDFAW